MIKLSTKRRYQRILKLLKKGREPKWIAKSLLISIHVVYDAKRRLRPI